MKTICKKSIVISIILLLFGVSVSSAVSVDTKSTISNNESDECRECEKSDSGICNLLELLFNTIIDRLDLVLDFYIKIGDNPILEMILMMYIASYYTRFYIYYTIGIFLNCDWTGPYPLKS
jgi:hypothetical protein